MRNFVKQLLPNGTSLAERIGLVALLLFPLCIIAGRSAMDVSCIIVALSFLYHCGVSRTWRTLWKQPWIKIAALFLLWILASSVWAYDIARAAGYALGWIRYPLLAAAMSLWLLNSGARRTAFFALLAGALTFIAADGVLQAAIGSDIFGNGIFKDIRLTGPFSKPIIGMMSVYFALPLLCFALAYRGNKKKQLALYVISGAILATVALSGERSALLLIGLGSGLCGLILCFTLNCWRILARGSLIITIATVISCGIVTTTSQSSGAIALGQDMPDHHADTPIDMGHSSINRAKSILMVIENLWETSYGQIWQDALAAHQKHPLLGVGAHNYRSYMCLPDTPRIFTAHCAFHPHNMWLHRLVELGLVGTLIMLALYGAIARKGLAGWRQSRQISDTHHAIYVGLLGTLFIRLWPLIATPNANQNITEIPLWVMIGLLLSYAAASAGTVCEPPKATDSTPSA